MTAGSRLVQAWSRAAELLGLDIEAPYSAVLQSGKTIEAAVLVRRFGAENGMLILTEDAQVLDQITNLHQSGFGFSVLSEPRPAEAFDLEVFVEVLRDWGWAGTADEKPSWY